MSTCIEPDCSAPRENKQSRCKAHRNAQLRERYHTDHDYRASLLAQQRARGTTPLRRRYLSDKLAEQEGYCAICGEAIPQGKAEVHIDPQAAAIAGRQRRWEQHSGCLRAVQSAQGQTEHGRTIESDGLAFPGARVTIKANTMLSLPDSRPKLFFFRLCWMGKSATTK